MAIYLLITLLIILVLAALAAVKGRVVVPPDHVGIVRRRFGPADPVFVRITPHDRRGIQARTLLPGRPTRMTPGLYSVTMVPRVHVPEGMIGIVVAAEGQSRPPGQLLGRHVECASFQDGQAFLANGGEQGRQAATLAGDHAYYINTHLFSVEFVPRTHVPAGTMGLVIARAGRVRPQGQRFARHVECASFQDGQAFMEAGGEQGRQLAVLLGGTSYDINPALFDVITTANVSTAGRQDGLTAHHLQDIAVPVGHTGVVITLEGADRERVGDGSVGSQVSGHQGFRLPWVFLDEGGWRGVQSETLGEGTVCSLNPWFTRVVLIPTRLLILEWKERLGDAEKRSYDAELGRLAVTIQGHKVHVQLSQTLRIPEQAAPKLVSAFGGSGRSGLGGLVDDPRPVQRFVEKVLGATVESYMSQIGAATTVELFLQRYNEARNELAVQVQQALQDWDVEADRTNLGTFEADDPKLNAELQAEASAQLHKRTLVVQRVNAETEDEIDEIRARALQRRTAMELRVECEELGVENVALIHMIREIKDMKVPEYIGGDIASYTNALPMPVLQTLLAQMKELRARRETPPRQEPPELAGS